MSLLKPNPNWRTFHQGWFGVCDTPCEEYDLAPVDIRSKIWRVFQYDSEHKTVMFFNGELPPQADRFLQHFTKLKKAIIFLVEFGMIIRVTPKH